jgi:hypothetical protein
MSRVTDTAINHQGSDTTMSGVIHTSRDTLESSAGLVKWIKSIFQKRKEHQHSSNSLETVETIKDQQVMPKPVEKEVYFQIVKSSEIELQRDVEKDIRDVLPTNDRRWN